MNTKEKGLEEEDSEEDILEEKNFQEKIKNLPKSYRKNWIWVSMEKHRKSWVWVSMEKHRKSWVWVSIGCIIVYTFFFWYMYFIGIFSLFYPIFYTIFYPLAVFFIYYGLKSKYKVLINKIMLIGCAGFGITVVIWFFASYILITSAPWALLQDVLPANSRFAILLILMGAIYGIVAYILYRFGKKREWKIIPDYQKCSI